MSKLRLGLFFLALLVVMLFFSFSRHGIYSQEVGVNLIVVGELKVSVFAIRPREQLATWIDLPTNLSVKTYRNGTTFPVTSLWKLGEAERDKYNYLTKSLTESMSVGLPRVINVGRETTPESLLGSLGSFFVETDLSLRDRILLRRDLTSYIAAKKIIEVDIPDSAMDRQNDPDGKEVITFNPVLQLWNKNKFLTESILGEELNVKVYNLSEKKGRALMYSRILESAGLRVIEVATGEEKNLDIKKSEGCYYVMQRKTHPFTEFFLTKHLGCNFLDGVKEGIGFDQNEVVVLIF